MQTLAKGLWSNSNDIITNIKTVCLVQDRILRENFLLRRSKMDSKFLKQKNDFDFTRFQPRKMGKRFIMIYDL